MAELRRGVLPGGLTFNPNQVGSETLGRRIDPEEFLRVVEAEAGTTPINPGNGDSGQRECNAESSSPFRKFLDSILPLR